jgi:hypothetical protein
MELDPQQTAAAYVEAQKRAVALGPQGFCAKTGLHEGALKEIAETIGRDMTLIFTGYCLGEVLEEAAAE